jgi:tetratricopeptide (TPR) repeat protein
MKIGSVMTVAVLALAASMPAASDPPAAPPKDPDTLVAELGDESYRVRQQATRELWDHGPDALPALQRAAAAVDDPERMVRARDLIRKIQLHITPGTDPAVVDLVEKFVNAPASGKTAVFGKLKLRRAWRQMLKLYAAETRPELREKLRPALAGVAARAARESLTKGDAASAREYLELAPVDAESLLALAVFHRSHGTLAAEIEKSRTAAGENAAAWDLALHRAAGDVDSSIAEASRAGESALSAFFSALAGDPLPTLAMVGEDGDEVVATYSSLAAKRWNGEKLRKQDTDPLTRLLAARDPSVRGAAINALFLLGRPDLAEAAFAKHEPLEAFLHFDALERVPESIAALGLAPEKPDYPTWVERRVGQLTEDDIEDQHEASREGRELVILANFLERRGLSEEAYDAFAAPLKRFAEKDENSFIDFIGELFGSQSTVTGAPELTLRIASEWAGKDAARWEEMVATCFGDEEDDRAWWSWLGEIDPKLPPADRFGAMMAVFRIGPDPGNLRSKWLGRLWKSVGEAPQASQAEMIARLSTMAVDCSDAVTSLKAWDRMPEVARNGIFWGQRITHLSAAGRWAEVAEVVLSHIRTQAGEDGEVINEIHAHAYAAAALRLAGKGDDAAFHDQWAEKLYLGNPSFALRIGNGYAFGGDYRRAAVWWRRAVIESAPDSSEVMLALKLYSDAMFEEGSWKESAATAEIMTRAYASSDYRWGNPLPYMKQRLQADLCRALARLKTQRAQAIGDLDECHRVFVTDGTLADIFFPAVRRGGLVREHDQWFEKTWKRMREVISAYPDSDISRNSAAWFASRALRRLDEAEEHLKTALAVRPEQPAYLDTMAEIEFARGNRDKALEWSGRAINFDPDDTQIRRQHERFRSDPLPK